MRPDIQTALAFASGAALAAAATAYLCASPRRSWSWWWKARGLSADALQSPAAPSSGAEHIGLDSALDDDIMREHFTRNIQFFGPESQQHIFGAFVTVIGLGVSKPLALVEGCHKLSAAHAPE